MLQTIIWLKSRPALPGTSHKVFKKNPIGLVGRIKAYSQSSYNMKVGVRINFDNIDSIIRRNTHIDSPVVTNSKCKISFIPRKQGKFPASKVVGAG